MSWLKDALVDIAVTVMIVLAAALDLPWARWMVLIYTPFMLIAKVLFFLGGHSISKMKQKVVAVPTWFFHLLYAINVTVAAGYALAGAGAATQHWWMIAGGWALIWILSIATDVRMRPVTAR